MARKLDADLVFLTDGQETPPLSWDKPLDFTGALHAVNGVIFGVGGYAFAPIPKFDTYGREIGVYKPGDVPSETTGLFRGREHLSAVDEPHLRALAAATGLRYSHLENARSASATYRAQARPVLRKQRLSLAWVTGGLTLLLGVLAHLPRRSPPRTNSV